MYYLTFHIHLAFRWLHRVLWTLKHLRSMQFLVFSLFLAIIAMTESFLTTNKIPNWALGRLVVAWISQQHIRFTCSTNAFMRTSNLASPLKLPFLKASVDEMGVPNGQLATHSYSHVLLFTEYIRDFFSDDLFQSGIFTSFFSQVSIICIGFRVEFERYSSQAWRGPCWFFGIISIFGYIIVKEKKTLPTCE